MSLRFDGRVAIVTGAGRGIGRAEAMALAGRGARVVVNDVGAGLDGLGADATLAALVVREIEAAGGVAIADTNDVSDPAGAAALVARAVRTYGGLDVVVGNAGFLTAAGVEALTRAELQRHFDVHVGGGYEITRAAWPHLVRSGSGRVVLTTSIGLFGAAHLLAYSTAKGAVASLGRALALAGAEHGIRVNLLAPNADTRMVTDPELRAQSGIAPADVVPHPRRGADTVAPMLLVLAHEDCPVSGEILTAGAGRLSRVLLAQTEGIVAHGLSAEGVLERWAEITDPAVHHLPVGSADAVRRREQMIADHDARTDP